MRHMPWRAPTIAGPKEKRANRSCASFRRFSRDSHDSLRVADWRLWPTRKVPNPSACRIARIPRRLTGQSRSTRQRGAPNAQPWVKSVQHGWRRGATFAGSIRRPYITHSPREAISRRARLVSRASTINTAQNAAGGHHSEGRLRPEPKQLNGCLRRRVLFARRTGATDGRSAHASRSPLEGRHDVLNPLDANENSDRPTNDLT